MRTNGLAPICIASLFLSAQESAAFDFTWTIGANATFCEPWMFVGGANIDGPPWYLWDDVTAQYIHIIKPARDCAGPMPSAE